MPTLVNNLRAIRGPVTAVPVTAGSGIEIAADTQNNQIVISANLEAGSGIEIVDDNGKAKIINSDNAQALPIVAGNGISLEYANDQLTINGETRTLLYSGSSSDARSGTFTLSQSAYNFDRIELTCIDVNNFVIKQVADMPDASLVNSNGTRGSWFNSVTDGTNTWFKAMNWKVNQAGTTLNYWVDEISTSGNSVVAINRDQTGNRPIMLRIYGYKTNYGA